MLGLAIAAMHYAAMVFTTFAPGAGVELIGEPVLSTGGLAIVVSLAAFVLCGLFLLVAVPFAVAPAEEIAPPPAPRGRSSQDTAFSRAFSAEPAPRAARIPYEQDQAIRFLAAHEIHAIKADGHYARLINGRGELFCPWSLSKLEKAVVPAPFMRTHRSFLVNLDHVSGFKRDGDKGFCLLGSGARAARAGQPLLPAARAEGAGPRLRPHLVQRGRISCSSDRVRDRAVARARSLR